MAKKISFTRGERNAVHDAIVDDIIPNTNLISLLAKMDAASTKAAYTGTSWVYFDETMGQVLGARWARPPNPDDTWYAMRTNALKRVGLQDPDVQLLADYLKARWRGNKVSPEAVTSRLTSLLAEAKEWKERTGDRSTQPLGGRVSGLADFIPGDVWDGPDFNKPA